MKDMKRKLFCAASIFAALLIVLTSMFCLYPSVAAMAAEEDGEWFYDQLATDQSRAIYSTLEDMYLSGDMETGTETVDLVKSGAVEDREHAQSVLTADFSAARDAFFLDYASVFYVDRDLLSIRQLAGSDGGYSITLGVGREDNYFYEGFNESNVKSAVSEYEAKIKSIAASCEGETRYETVHNVFSYFAKNVRYALESDATAGCEYFVRTAYGAAVKGEACCEGFARAFKAVLDELGVPCVLVQGMFVGTDDDENAVSQAHMWTYVRMDDNRWYLCDPTMQEASSFDDKYFLACGLNDLLCFYQADGVISVGEGSYEFYYPMLSYVEYTDIASSNFTIEDIDGYLMKVSYKGQNVADSAAKGEYIIYSTGYGDTWYYVSGSYADMGQTPDEYDFDGYFEFVVANSSYTFAVTSEAPTGEEFFGLFSGDPDTIYDVSYTVGEYVAATRLIATGSSAVCEGEAVSTRLSPEKTYTVTVRFSENLTTIYSEDEVDVNFIENSYVTAEDVKVKDVSYSGNTVTFTFSTIQTYHSSLMYYFEIEGLMGLESKFTPDPVGFSVVNNPVFSCPYVEGDYNQIYASTPVLILDGDMSDMEFVDANENTVSGSVSNKFSLVVSTPSSSDTQEMLDALSDEVDEILSYAVYDISLGLCDKQVSWVSGERVKVYIPFPEGYSYESVLSGEATFKAYHYGDNGDATEIECVVTETGIIIYCDSFSPFAVIATTPTGEEPRNAAVMTSGHGDVTVEGAKCDLVSLEAGGSATLSITPKEGYVVDRVTVNGVDAEFEKEGCTLTIKYEDLEFAGNVIEVTFAAASVVEAEEEAGYAVIHPEEDGEIASSEEEESSESGGAGFEGEPGAGSEGEPGKTEETADESGLEGDENANVEGESSGIPTYGIVLIVVAAVIVIAVLAAALVILTRHGRNKEDGEGEKK